MQHPPHYVATRGLHVSNSKQSSRSEWCGAGRVLEREKKAIEYVSCYVRALNQFMHWVQSPLHTLFTRR